MSETPATTLATLADFLERGPLDAGAVLELARDVCAALAPLHARRRVAGELGAARLRWGGQRWEIAGLGEAAPGDEREDVRAVAGVLYRALGEPAPLALPRDLRAPIMRGLHERPERRYGTVTELAAALGVAPPPPPARPRWPPLLPALLLGLAAGGVARLPPAPHAPGAARALARADAPAPARVAVGLGDFLAPGAEPWLGDGVADMLGAVLAERPGLEVTQLPGAATLNGRVELDGDTLVVEVQLVAGGATRFAERLAVPSRGALIDAADGLGDRLARALGGGAGPHLDGLTTGSLPAYRAYIEGDAARAARLDPSFFQPRARLGDLAAARALVGRAGRRGAAMLERMETAARARSGRLEGRFAECAVDAERAGLPLELAWCRLGLGDREGARAAAVAAGDVVLVGDLELMAGRLAEARAAYLRAGATARLALVDLRARGRCKTPIQVKSVDDALVEAALARACGDWDRARAAEGFVARADGALAAELAVERAALRGERGGWEKARRQLAAKGAGGARGRRLGPLFAAARADGHAAEALVGYAPQPSDRWGLFEEPVLWQAALAQIEAGDAEGAALACAEVQAAAPSWAPALYCVGRAAEAAGDVAGAFRAYRELLDRLADADEENRLVRETARRLRALIAHAHRG